MSTATIPKSNVGATRTAQALDPNEKNGGHNDHTIKTPHGDVTVQYDPKTGKLSAKGENGDDPDIAVEDGQLVLQWDNGDTLGMSVGEAGYEGHAGNQNVTVAYTNAENGVTSATTVDIGDQSGENAATELDYALEATNQADKAGHAVPLNTILPEGEEPPAANGEDVIYSQGVSTVNSSGTGSHQSATIGEIDPEGERHRQDNFSSTWATSEDPTIDLEDQATEINDCFGAAVKNWNRKASERANEGNS